jgi:tetratricopeptide (TPR) repeat protein
MLVPLAALLLAFAPPGTTGALPAPAHPGLPAPPALAQSADAGVSMRSIYEALAGLEPYLAQPALLREQKNHGDVLLKLDRLAALNHIFPADPTTQEPALAALSSLFARYASDTRRQFVEGDRLTTPLRVRTLVGLCFSCHSRERAPVDFANADRRIDELNLSPFERAQYLAATRQFDKALDLTRAQLRTSPRGERAVLEYSRLLRDALALLVRVKDDSAAAASLLAEAAALRDLPPFLRRPISRWRQDIDAWRAERFDALKATPEQLFERAKSLVRRVNGPHGLLPEETSEVLALRASAYLNLALSRSPKPRWRGEALFMLGMCEAALKSPSLWDVDLLYFEACIQENPKTAVATKCFQQLSERLYFGYTGSSGTHLPEDELQRLATLRALAE